MGERNVDQSIGFGVTRNTYSAHSKFSENAQAEKMVDRTGKLLEGNSSNAQIRTLLDEQRQMIIAECCEKIGHHELQAARAEEERRFLREEQSVSKKIFVKFINKVLVRWRIFCVLEKLNCMSSSSVFLRRMNFDSTTYVEFAGLTRGQFVMARRVRQGFPASGFLFAMAFDPIFRWLQDAIIPRTLPAWTFYSQLSARTHADDLAVAAFSFWAVDQKAGAQFELSGMQSGVIWL